ncbi:MAG TPA: DNA-directed RNA polymerase subunit alpha C-terminal domain-containing protein, partial [Bacteroidia bacterium]|nr:DNA-directed RNA polymerase subunit alpha C-terminal domain-containing protein [Bacteroidia bacterium]
IEKTNLSVRVKNICWNAEINRVSDLVGYSRSRFGKLRNAGKKAGNEVELFLKNSRLSWEMQR